MPAEKYDLWSKPKYVASTASTHEPSEPEDAPTAGYDAVREPVHVTESARACSYYYGGVLNIFLATRHCI